MEIKFVLCKERGLSLSLQKKGILRPKGLKSRGKGHQDTMQIKYVLHKERRFLPSLRVKGVLGPLMLWN